MKKALAANKSLRRPCIVRARKTGFVAILRSTPVNTVCPNFYVLRHAAGCSFSPQCAYCYLKLSYWSLSRPHVFSNVAKMLADVKHWLRQSQLESYLLNMGNLADSLVFEEQRPILPQLIELFRQEAEARRQPHSLLLVTKGGLRECQSLLGLPVCRNVIISFSVNARAAAKRYELGAALVSDRLAAARRLQQAGWRLRIRIDPIIAGFDYSRIADQVKKLAPERVTLGTLRAEVSLPRFIQKGLFAKLIKPRSHHGLARYRYRERLHLYQQVLNRLGNDSQIGLCEETPALWQALDLDFSAQTCNCNL